jgi:divalent metal cation (Fe/Co/Zn/Cd) transporter
MWTGWLPFDPIVAILVASNILWSGGQLMRRSIGGLMDEADPAMDKKLTAVLEEEAARYGIRYHDLRHRNAGAKLQIEVHLLFPDKLSIAEAHEQATLVENALRRAVDSETEITTHLEPVEGHDEVHGVALGKKTQGS